MHPISPKKKPGVSVRIVPPTPPPITLHKPSIRTSHLALGGVSRGIFQVETGPEPKSFNHVKLLFKHVKMTVLHEISSVWPPEGCVRTGISCLINCWVQSLVLSHFWRPGSKNMKRKIKKITLKSTLKFVLWRMLKTGHMVVFQMKPCA